MRNPFSLRDALWLISVIVIALVWYLDRAALLERADMYKREFYDCHEKLEELQKQTESRQAPSGAFHLPHHESWLIDPTPDPLKSKLPILPQ
ncbi:MAG TPA: hypothetical protein VGI75_10840 [Pirellulales bacterium]|jgi:hypothetical protein